MPTELACMQMASHLTKKSEGLCTRAFSIPSVAEIKHANKVSANRNPTLFKATTATSSDSVKEKEQVLTTAVVGANGLESDAAPVKGSIVSFPGSRVEQHVDKTWGHLSRNLEEGSEAAVSHNESTGPECAATGVSGCRDSGGPGGERAPESVAEASSHVATSTSMGTAGHHHPHAIVTNPVQRKNPLMRHIRNVPWELGDIVPDFVLGRTACALFLSVRYHSLHPDYIHTRLKELGKQYDLRILLVLVDTSECHKILQELAKIAILADLTLILAWSYEEAGRYLETYKAYENKPPDLLMERVDSDFTSRVTESLTTVKKVNKTDAATLLNNFKTMERVILASREELTLCPGLGPQKAQRLHDLFHEPFIRPKKPKLD